MTLDIVHVECPACGDERYYHTPSERAGIATNCEACGTDLVLVRDPRGARPA